MAAARTLFAISALRKSSFAPLSTPKFWHGSSSGRRSLGQGIRLPSPQSEDPGSRQWPLSAFQVGCMSGESRKVPARLAQMQQLMEAREADTSEANLPIPRVTLDHVTLNFARSGGPGGQNVNKVNTKVDMRFKVMGADWLPERVRLKLLQMEKNRVNSDGELIVSSTKTRTQKGNIEDALAKLQSMIDAAAYVPPSPSAETKNRIQKLARVENEKRLTHKKQASTKKSIRRNKGNWD